MFEAVKAAGGGPDIYGSECTKLAILIIKETKSVNLKVVVRVGISGSFSFVDCTANTHWKNDNEKCGVPAPLLGIFRVMPIFSRLMEKKEKTTMPKYGNHAGRED
jgi:hypothetical protein